MEGHIDSDYGKMGMGVVRYLKNPIVGVVDKAFEGRAMTVSYTHLTLLTKRIV